MIADDPFYDQPPSLDEAFAILDEWHGICDSKGWRDEPNWRLAAKALDEAMGKLIEAEKLINEIEVEGEDQ